MAIGDNCKTIILSSNSISNWNNLPSLILNELFSYLNYKDKIQASSTCKQWRDALHHTNQLPEVNFCIRDHDEDKVIKSNYLAQCLARKAKHVTLSFDSISSTCLQLLANILENLCTNPKVRKVVLNPSHCFFNKDASFVKKYIVQRLLKVIETSDFLQEISLGCSEVLFQKSAKILDLLVKHHANSLRALMLATIRDDPDHYNLPKLDVSLMGSFVNLQSCSIDYDYVSDGFLQSLSGCSQLKVLAINVHGIIHNHPGTTNYAWLLVRQNNPMLKVRLNLIHAFDAVSMFHLTILRSEMPLSHLRVFFCEYLNIEVFNMIGDYYKELESLWWVDSFHGGKSNGEILLDTYIRLNPLVIAAWRLKHLKELVFLGYKCFVDDIVAMMRLRKFKKLELAYEDIFTDMHSTYNLKTVISEGKNSTEEGDTWRPLRYKDLHPVLINPDFGDSDEYILPIVQSDLCTST